MQTDYSFVFIKSKTELDVYHPINIEIDICNGDYIFNIDSFGIYTYSLHVYKHIIEDKLLNNDNKYLIQTNSGKFGYYSVGKPIHIFENEEVETDIYHFYFMNFSM